MCLLHYVSKNSVTQTKTLQTCDGSSDACDDKFSYSACSYTQSSIFFKIISRRASDVDGECSLPYLIVNAGWHAAFPDIS